MVSRRPFARHNRGLVAGVPAGLLTNDIAQIGDSITQGAGSTGDNGWRQAIYDHVILQAYPYRFVGSRNHGTFGAAADRNHDGLPAAQTSARLSFVKANYGPGKRFPGGKLWILMIGTNDMRQPGAQYNLAASMNNVAGIIAHMMSPAGWQFAKGLVMNCLEINPAVEAEAAGRVAAYNAGLITVCDGADAAHPTNALIRYDANAAVGNDFVNDYLADGIHLDDSGYAKLSPGLVAAADPALAIAA